MLYVEAPTRFDRYTHRPVLFLAGGISNCPNWQRDVVNRASEFDLVLLNPRREAFEGVDPAEQIRWEFDHLRITNAVLFWFPAETLCPITLFEYGKILVGDKPVFVGTHPDYERRTDVVVQTSLQRPTVRVHDSLTEVVREALLWSEKFSKQ